MMRARHPTGGLTISSSRPDKILPWPMPDPMHLYMLVAGIVLGILLGPAVLNKALPDTYDKLFIGSGDTSQVDQAQAAIDRFDNDADYRKERIDKILQQAHIVAEEGDSAMIGANEHIAQLTNGFADEKQQLVIDMVLAQQPVDERRRAHDEKLSGLSTLLLLLVVVIMAAEPVLAPQRTELNTDGRAVISPALPRLITARYGLIAGWITLALAKPDWLLQIDPALAIVLVPLLAFAAFVPLGRAKKA